MGRGFWIEVPVRLRRLRYVESVAQALDNRLRLIERAPCRHVVVKRGVESIAQARASDDLLRGHTRVADVMQVWPPDVRAQVAAKVGHRVGFDPV